MFAEPFSEIIFFIFVGFAAQLVDGAIGMAYGLIGSLTLISFGIPPATASASIHAAEVFTTGASGLSHWRFKNIDFSLVKRLVPAGMAGGFIGAFILAEYASTTLSLIIAFYLFIMGGVVLRRGFGKFSIIKKKARYLAPLGFVGGLLDAIGGGGWGPLVNSNLIGQGTNPRISIGSTSLAEFFVATTISSTFFFTIGLSLWPIITGLVIGGVIAAPFAALAAKKLPTKILMVIVGLAIMVLSARVILTTAL